MSRRWLTLFVLGSLSACGRPDSEAIARCRATTSGELRNAAVALHVGSRLTPESINPGSVPRCEDDARALDAFEAASRARNQLPAGLAPTTITLHLGPNGVRPMGIEFHEATGSLLVERNPAAAVDQTVWLHELTHVRSRGARPAALAARRVYRALEEGVADYVASVVAGTPGLGRDASGNVVRDLTSPPEKTTREWSLLALPKAPFDAHSLGWQLAAELHRRAPKSIAVAEDLVTALATSEPMQQVTTPAQALQELSRRCPERSRGLVDAAVRSWVFAEVLGE